MIYYPKFPAICDSCGHQVPFERIDDSVCSVLLDAHYYRYFVEELRMLNKMADFYRRNPHVDGKIKPHALRVISTHNGKVLEKLADDVPLSEIELPPEEQEHPIAAGDPSDGEVIEYLRHNYFKLEPRLIFVTEGIERNKYAANKVSCSKCKNGHLQLVGGNI